MLAWQGGKRRGRQSTWHAIAKAVGFKVEGVSFRVDQKFGKPPSVLASVLEKFHENTKMVENGHRSTRRRRTAGGIADL
jgi:hypothetical protein